MRTIGPALAGMAGAVLLSASGMVGTASAAPDTAAPDTAAPDATDASGPGAFFGAFVLTSGSDTVQLTCTPDGGAQGTHPDPEAACDTIRAAGGDFDALQTEEFVACPMYYREHPVRAVGLWADEDGTRLVDEAQTYGNQCVASVDSGGVFRF